MEEIIIVVLCLALNGLLSAFEMAFVSVPKIELRRLARKGNKIASKLLPLRDSPERTLSVIQIGITLVGAISAAVGGAGASESIEPYFINKLGLNESTAEMLSIIIVVLPITYLSVVLGELVPKTLALRNPTGITLGGAKYIIWADRLFGPVISLLEASTRIIVKTFFPKTSKNSQSADQSSVELTHLTQPHQQLVLKMASMESKLIQDFYVPWEKVIHVDMNETLENVVKIIFKEGHTRLPVTQGELVVGVVSSKEILAARESGISDWLTVLRPAVRVSSSDTALNALRLLQGKRSHLAVVDDCKGIITLEDISEEIFGEIYDEYEDGRVQKLIASRARARRSALSE